MLKKDKLLYFAVPYLFILILITPLQLKAEPPDISPWFNQAVLLKTYQQSYDWRIPWEKGEITTQTGMGLVVSLPELSENLSSENFQSEKLYLMTTAELVANATLIEATRKDTRVPFQAKLMRMDFAANLALIEINNAKFWNELKPVNSLSHLDQMLKKMPLETVHVVFESKWQSLPLVLNFTESLEQHRSILKRYGIEESSYIVNKNY